MKRIRYYVTAALAMASFAFMVHDASATPAVNSAEIKPRVFNDCPSSHLTLVNTYPALISIQDDSLSCFGFANRHTWRLSTDGTTAAEFANGDEFTVCATMVLAGTSGGEGGLQITRWFDPDVDGVLYANASSGEVAAFGGRLPFYSFTDPTHGGLHYVKGTPIYLQMDYKPNGTSMASPATIVYTVTYLSNTYASPPLAFDEGNPAEIIPHGTWGILSPAYVGGYVQCLLQGGNDLANFGGTWAQICFSSPPTAARNSSWGQIKASYH